MLSNAVCAYRLRSEVLTSRRNQLAPPSAVPAACSSSGIDRQSLHSRRRLDRQAGESFFSTCPAPYADAPGACGHLQSAVRSAEASVPGRRSGADTPRGARRQPAPRSSTRRSSQRARRRAPRSCSTRLCPIDLGDGLVIQLPQNLEAPIGPGRLCPIRSQQGLHDPWEQIRVNTRVAVELKLKRAIVQTVQSVGGATDVFHCGEWRHVSWAVSRERRTRI